MASDCEDCRVVPISLDGIFVGRTVVIFRFQVKESFFVGNMFWSDSDRMGEWLDSFVYRCIIVSIHGGGFEDENSAGRDSLI